MSQLRAFGGFFFAHFGTLCYFLAFYCPIWVFRAFYAVLLRFKFVVIYALFRVKLFWLKPWSCKKLSFCIPDSGSHHQCRYKASLVTVGRFPVKIEQSVPDGGNSTTQSSCGLPAYKPVRSSPYHTNCTFHMKFF